MRNRLPVGFPSFALASVALGAALVTACQPTALPARLDLATVAPCAHEDGVTPGSDGLAQTYPCVWDGATAGEGPGAGQYAGPRWLLYVAGPCPVPTVQPDEAVRCFDVREYVG